MKIRVRLDTANEIFGHAYAGKILEKIVDKEGTMYFRELEEKMDSSMDDMRNGIHLLEHYALLGRRIINNRMHFTSTAFGREYVRMYKLMQKNP